MPRWTYPIAVIAIASAAIPLSAFALDVAAAQDDAASLSADAQVVARDPVTGALRAATADEVKALQRARGAQARSGSPTSARYVHANGARGARLTDDFMNYSIVLRGADGKLVEICVQDPSVVANPAQPKSATLPTE
ncbi:MAG TPA: hypothetical protein VL624_20720 [Caldimonas sp.]|jgi:hypothetical protein|nr:hypothetical protein [Caldimonas sp.]